MPLSTRYTKVPLSVTVTVAATVNPAERVPLTFDMVGAVVDLAGTAIAVAVLSGVPFTTAFCRIYSNRLIIARLEVAPLGRDNVVAYKN